MRAVLAVIINMGVIHCPDIQSYWKTSWECNIPFFHDVFPRDRFEIIFWTLHIHTTSTRRRLDKIRPLLDRVVATSQSVFYPGREVSVDETMVGFKGVVTILSTEADQVGPEILRTCRQCYGICSKHHSVHWRRDEGDISFQL